MTHPSKRPAPLPPHPQAVGKKRLAFTLIELLVVVAIISILASIAVPNFLEAQTRAKVARTASDMRALATGLETYRLDNNRMFDRQTFPSSPTIRGFADVTKKAEDWEPLTTPIAYLTKIPVDIFWDQSLSRDGSAFVDYWDRRVVVDQIPFLSGAALAAALELKPAWAVVSIGPDGSMGQPGGIGRYPVPPSFLFGTHTTSYDPTNGTISAGNVFRFADDLSAEAVFRAP